jgi:hypothetical protein
MKIAVSILIGMFLTGFLLMMWSVTCCELPVSKRLERVINVLFLIPLACAFFAIAVIGVWMTWHWGAV